MHYRAAPHATADDPRAYIDLARVEEERARECVGRTSRFLRRIGVLTDERGEAVRKEAEDLLRAGIAAAEAEPPADPGAALHARLRRPAAGTCAMAELTLVEAVNDALHTELERDDDVMVLGEDVGRAGGVFRATAGLLDRFGADRCVDTPLAEAGLLGARRRSLHGRLAPGRARCSTTRSRTRASTS